MSVEACDFLTDEELDLGEDGLSNLTYVSDSEKRTRKKKTLSKAPPSPRSPYLSSASLHSKRSPAAAWRAVRSQVTGSQVAGVTGVMLGENPAARTPRDVWLAALKNGHALTQSPMKAEYDVTQTRVSMTTSTPEYLKEAFGMRKPKHSRSASNGYVPGTPDFKEKEDMYDEILELKKTVCRQKEEGDRMKAKLRRLEEENSKKERQIDQLLDPTKGPECSRSLLNRKSEGNVVVNGLKQRVLRLEQQCREKESVLSKLQSDLKTTNMEEMKITMETYYEEVQRLRLLLESAEKSSRLEIKDGRRQQKVLTTTVLKLSRNVKQLEEENLRLKQEVTQEVNSVMDSPTSRAKGYIDWSKQRLVRRILDLERKLEELRSRQAARDAETTYDKATRCVSVATETDPTSVADGDQQQDCVRLRAAVRRLREERSTLQDRLNNTDAELRRVSAERDERMEGEKALSERTREYERATLQHREEVEELSEKMRKLEERLEEEEERRKSRSEQHNSQVQDKPSSSPAPSSSSSPPSPGERESVEQTEREKERESVEQTENERESVEQTERENERESVEQTEREKERESVEQTEREKERESVERREAERDSAVRLIQTHWHAHRTRDAILLQSVLRGHLNRQRQLLKLTHTPPNAKSSQSEGSSEVRCSGERHDGLLEEEVALLQSVFRAHMRRCTFTESRVPAGTESAASESVTHTPLQTHTHKHTHTPLATTCTPVPAPRAEGVASESRRSTAPLAGPPPRHAAPAEPLKPSTQGVCPSVLSDEDEIEEDITEGEVEEKLHLP